VNTFPQPARAGGGDIEASVERRFRQILEAAPDGIIEADPQGRIVLINQAAENMFGYAREELLGKTIEELVPAAVRGRHTGHRSSYTAHPQTRPMGSGLRLQAQKKDGSLFPVEISLSPNRTGDSMNVIAMVRDISERQQIEDRLRVIQEQYTAELNAKNQELEARNKEIEKADRHKSEFLASMSHELRTPLHTVIGFSELLSEEIEGPLNEKQKRFLGHILQDARHLLELINEVLDISKIEAGKLELQPETFEFAAALEEVLTGVRHQTTAKNIQLENKNTFQDVLYADRVRVKEMLYNLLSNAVKFTTDGGTVWLESRVNDGFLEITVADTGMGIPTEEQAAIFDKFYQASSTTKGVREGTGLGLPITVVKSWIWFVDLVVGFSCGCWSIWVCFWFPLSFSVPPFLTPRRGNAGEDFFQPDHAR
jgi:PAS domain S-box-containing protein